MNTDNISKEEMIRLLVIERMVANDVNVLYARDKRSFEEHSRIYAAAIKAGIEIYSLRNEEVKNLTDRLYKAVDYAQFQLQQKEQRIKELEESLHEIDIDLASLEDVLHGDEGRKVTAMRYGLQQLLNKQKQTEQ